MLIIAMTVITLASAEVVSETMLPNGLKVLIKENNAAPVVVIDVWYKVGSRNETVGMTGASHLLEHMTYKGTRDFARDDMRNLVKRNGALDNGATFYDYTHYYTTIAADRLSLVLKLEASRMQNALILQNDLDSERTVVRSELEGNENNPGTLLFQEMMSAAFRSHPYRWPVIGFRADVTQITADQLRNYYHHYYLPNNATLVIVGAVNSADALKQVRKIFGRIPRGTVPSQWVTPESQQYGERRIMVRRPGKLPIEFISWHIPDINHPDIPALTMLDQLLGTGRLSPLYQRIVEQQLGMSAWTQIMTHRDAGLFLAAGVANPEGKLSVIEEQIFQAIEKIKDNPPQQPALTRALRQLEAAMIFAGDSITEQAAQLGEAETVTGNWRYSEKLLAELRTVTGDDVSRVARKYLTEVNRTVGIFLPTATPESDTTTNDSSATFQTSAVPENITTTGDNQINSVPKAPLTIAKERKRERFLLPGGISLILQESPANPTVAVSIITRAGKAYETDHNHGAADMVANLLDRGTATRTPTQIAEELEGAAIEITTGTGWETAGMHGKALNSDIDLLLRNMADQLRNATFPTEEIEKMRSQMLSGLAMSRDDPDEAARRAFYRAVLPVGNAYHLASFDEEEAGLKELSQHDLLTFYHARYRPAGLIIAIVGDIDIAQTRALIEKYFGDWQGEQAELLDFTGATPGTPASISLEIADKSSSIIYLGHAALLKRNDSDYYAADIMNMILGGGGALNSRLGKVIRDQHGLAYSVYSLFHASSGNGPWYTVLGVNPQNTATAIELARAEIYRMVHQGVSKQEVADAIAYQTGAYLISLETNSAMASTLADAEYFQLGIDFPEKVSDYYRAVTVSQVNAAAKKYLNPEDITTVVAGSLVK